MTPRMQPANEGLNAAVAAEFRAELARQRRSTQWLADESGVAYGTLRRYLAAERHIDVSVLFALAQALGVEPGQVVSAAERHVVKEDLSEAAPSVPLAIAAHEDGSIAGEQESTNET